MFISQFLSEQCVFEGFYDSGNVPEATIDLDYVIFQSDRLEAALGLNRHRRGLPSLSTRSHKSYKGK